jgi:6-phosphogluconolactonase
MIEVEVLPDPEAVGARAAGLVGDALREAVASHGRCAWAISGGETPIPMFRRLSGLDLPWHLIDTWQVDERIAPIGDPERNRTVLSEVLPEGLLDGVRWMPVEDADPEAAATRYEATLPGRFDLVHLGLGADGHTASLVPGDPALDVRDHGVAVTGPYQGRRRMTLTFAGLARAARAVWVVTGSEKREAITKLLAGDPSIPAADVPVAVQTLVTNIAVP